MCVWEGDYLQCWRAMMGWVSDEKDALQDTSKIVPIGQWPQGHLVCFAATAALTAARRDGSMRSPRVVRRPWYEKSNPAKCLRRPHTHVQYRGTKVAVKCLAPQVHPSSVHPARTYTKHRQSLPDRAAHPPTHRQPPLHTRPQTSTPSHTHARSRAYTRKRTRMRIRRQCPGGTGDLFQSAVQLPTVGGGGDNAACAATTWPLPGGPAGTASTTAWWLSTGLLSLMLPSTASARRRAFTHVRVCAPTLPGLPQPPLYTSSATPSWYNYTLEPGNARANLDGWMMYRSDARCEC